MIGPEERCDIVAFSLQLTELHFLQAYWLFVMPERFMSH